METNTPLQQHYNVIIIGGGHNGLVAACYLALRAPHLKILVLEANATLGGATQSERIFPEYDARLSRFSYLVAVLPDQIVQELQLDVTCLSTRVESYTPYTTVEQEHTGLYISPVWDDRSIASFQALPNGDRDLEAWQKFYGDIGTFAQRLAPTWLQPLPSRSQLRATIGMNDVWETLIEKPIGKTIAATFQNDLVRGIALNDALIGTFASAHDTHANACFLYHVTGNGSGEWKVPRGGMGALVQELHRVATQAGVDIVTDHRVVHVASNDDQVTVTVPHGSFTAEYLLCNAAPSVLASLRGASLGAATGPHLDGSQLKINVLVTKLPRLKSGLDPHEAFAGTFYVHQGFTQLELAYQQALAGQLPTKIPMEIYCHSLTDPTILGADLQQQGYHTLTLFCLHTPAHLFDVDHDAQRARAQQLALDSLNDYLLDPIESVLARNKDGTVCIETMTPLDLQDALGLPRGNIFHGGLSWPFYEDEGVTSLPYPRWGVETDDERIFLCGAGAARGGCVSGIAGHNAAMAILERLPQQSPCGAP